MIIECSYTVRLSDKEVADIEARLPRAIARWGEIIKDVNGEPSIAEFGLTQPRSKFPKNVWIMDFWLIHGLRGLTSYASHARASEKLRIIALRALDKNFDDEVIDYIVQFGLFAELAYA